MNQIEKLAQQYADCVEREYGISERIKRLIKSAYIVGANERLSNVWHPASEYPSKVGAILYQTTLGQFRTVCDGKCGEGAWKVFAIDQDVARWVYIKDLLPKYGHEQ